MESKRRKRISFDADGEVHEFTFSTYRRRPILSPDPEACRVFLQKLDGPVARVGSRVPRIDECAIRAALLLFTPETLITSQPR